MQKSRAKENSNFERKRERERDKMRSARGDNLLEEVPPPRTPYPLFIFAEI